MVAPLFASRDNAGHLLAAELVDRNISGTATVLALPRGGVPVGWEIAKALRAPLDVVIVRKLGVPWQPELAMGAAAGGNVEVLDWEMIQELRVSQDEIDTVTAKERVEIARRVKLYRGGRPAHDVHGRTVVLVDDGLATGSTMLVAARYVSTLKPCKLIIAVPVGSAEACRRMRSVADQCVCLATPEPFHSVGEWYEDFTQVSDNEVKRLLRLQPAA